MGLWNNIKRAVTKATKILPPLAVMVPIGGKEQRKNAVEGLKIGATIAAAKTLVTAPTAPTAANAIDPVTGEFTSAYQAAPGVGDWTINPGSSVAKAAATVLPLISGGSVQEHPISQEYVQEPSFIPMPGPAFPYSTSYQELAKAPSQDNMAVPLVIGVLGLLLLTR